MSQEQLQELEGIGRVKAIQLRCLTEITKRMMRSLDGEEILLCDNPAIVARCIFIDAFFGDGAGSAFDLRWKKCGAG